jgi:DNA-binding transcriptional ArsR family regulator
MVDYPKNSLNLAVSALADQTRRAILSQLLEQDLTVKQVAQTYEMSLAAISKHLQVLTKAGLVRQIKQGREKICQLEPNALRTASLWMESFGFFPADFLDEVEAELDTLGLSPQPEDQT